MKELLLSFLACLVIGAVINGMSVPAPQAPPIVEPTQQAQEQQPGDAFTSDANGAASTTGSGTSSTSGASSSKHTNSLKAQETGDSSFEQDVLKSQVPVLVDFNAAWCVPCQTMAPIVDNLAMDYSGKVKVYKVDTDRNPALKDKFHVNALPTFMMFRDGQPVSQYSGAMAKEMLVGVIDHQLGTQ